MPFLDVSDVLTDPDFVSRDLVRARRAETVGNDGIASYVDDRLAFVGVVTNGGGDILARLADAQYVRGTITIHTRADLSTAAPGRDADIVEWRGRRYTVTEVQDYGHFGRGFTAVTCEPIPLL